MKSVSAPVAARVGYSGTKVHSLTVTVQRTSLQHPREPGALAVYYGAVNCGSRRGLSGDGVVSLDASKVNCERCLAHGPVYRGQEYSGHLYLDDATTIVTYTGRRLVPVDPFPYDIEEATR
jgi:hypothetical protein